MPRDAAPEPAPPPRHLASSQQVAASATPAVATPTASPPVAAKPPAASPEPPSPSSVPYPVDAGPSVAQGQLTLVPLSGGTRVEVSAGPGWVAGQQIFIFVGERYQTTLAGPGASGVISPGGPSAVVSGFQFPSNSIAAPVDGAGTVSLAGAG